jgi:hypothetical protein
VPAVIQEPLSLEVEEPFGDIAVVMVRQAEGEPVQVLQEAMALQLPTVWAEMGAMVRLIPSQVPASPMQVVEVVVANTISAVGVVLV